MCSFPLVPGTAIFLERFASLRYGRYSFSSGSFMKGDWIFGKFSKFGISQGSVPFPKYPSERRMTGVVYSKAIFAASKAASKQSEGDCGAITGMGASPFLPCTAWSRSACSVFVGSPVDGPPRCTFIMTMGSSSINPNPSPSVFSAIPGPEVAVTPKSPAKEAPMIEVMAAISSSA